MYVLTELGYVLICHVKEKRKKKCSFENALVEKSESSTRNKNGLVEGLLLFSIQMFTFTDLSRYIIDLHPFAKPLELLAINHSSSERRIIFVPRLLKFSHVLVVL